MFFPLYDDNPTRRWPVITILLIVFNVVVHLFVSQMSDLEQGRFYAEWGFVPKKIEQLSDPNLVVTVPIDLEGDEEIAFPADPERIIASVFTTMFLHADWIHLALNMWMLWIYGNNIEDRLGHIFFILFYLAVGMLATSCHWATHPDSVIPVVGASGAIAGVLGAYAITFPKAKVKTIVFLGYIIFPANVPALIVLGFWFIIEFIQFQFHVIDPNVAGVAFAAHVGGFLAGLFLMPLMAMGAPEPGTHWEDEIDEAFGQ